MGPLLPGWAMSAAPGVASILPALSGEDIKLVIGHTPVTIDGKAGHAVTTNGTVPGPLLRLRQGQRARISVTNTLDEDTSIHWHGLLVPPADGRRAGRELPGRPAGRDLRLRLPGRSWPGTYWYHSHSGLQEAEGPLRPHRDRAGRSPIRSGSTASMSSCSPTTARRTRT